MKIKNNFILCGIFSLFFFSSAFVNPSIESQEIPESGDLSFAEFLSHFEKAEMPFEVNLNNMYKYQDQRKKEISATQVSKRKKSRTKPSKPVFARYIPELKSGVFSRSGPPQIMPVARFYPNDKMIAVVYMTYNPYWDHKRSDFKLALYHLDGKLVSNNKEELHFLEGFGLAHNSIRKTETFSIDGAGNIKKKHYTNVWAKDIKEHGIKLNEIIAYDLKTTETFRIGADGLVKETKEYPTDARASLD